MPNVHTPESCVDLLQAMVRHDTVTPRTSGRADAERKLGDYVAAVAESWGLEVQRLPVEGCAPNVLVTHQQDREAPWLLLDSHLDTVGTAEMTVDPFAAEVRDARLYGRGACDTKGSGAAMLWAMRKVAAAKSAASNVALLFSVGEEVCQVGARSFLENDLEQLPWRPAAVIVGEPTSMQITRATNGFVRLRIVTIGHAAHSSAPEQGRNAVSDMARAIVALEEQYIAKLSQQHALTGRSTCSINIIRGGTEHNVVPERCEVTVDHRLVPGQCAEDAVAQIRRVLDELAAGDGGFAYRIEGVEFAAPFTPDLNGRLSEQAAAALQAAGVEASIHGAPYTTNANHHAAHGLAALVIGPGNIAQAHTKDEWIALEQLELGVRGYQALMETSLG